MTQGEANFASASAVVRLLAQGLATEFPSRAQRLLRQEVKVAHAQWAATTVGEFLELAAEATCCFALVLTGGSKGPQAKVPDRAALGCGYLEFPPQFASGAIDLLLGGGAQGAGAARKGPLTSIDRRLLRRVVEAACESLLPAGTAGDLRIAPAPQRGAAPAPPVASSPAAAMCFEIHAGPLTGGLRVVIAQESLEAIQTALSPQARQQGQADLSADVEEPAAGVDLTQLGAGDILATDSPPDGEVIVRIDGEPRFAARLGQINGHRAVTITRKLEQQS